MPLPAARVDDEMIYKACSRSEARRIIVAVMGYTDRVDLWFWQVLVVTQPSNDFYDWNPDCQVFCLPDVFYMQLYPATGRPDF